MACTNLNFNVDVNKCFNWLSKSGGKPKIGIKKLKKEIEKLKAKRHDIKSKIEEAKREGRLASFQNNIKVGPWGVAGDCNFDIGRSASQITKVRLHTGVVVDNLEISYIVDGKNVETRRLGGGGGRYHTVELLPGEYINSMVGFVGAFNGESCISQLKFKTNFGNTHGPFGEGGGNEFTVPVTDGRIVGFFGQYDKYLKEIGVYVALN
ncbi:protein GOS9-like isoform X2 [Zingiber officinale]|uniref:protein GOS9-like isoform X2 n=1 Tax=Zingiber officinale TaxID=94328 RepID=UPI001C4C521C|nr:protein GOS9-like isoform X2 [Zingiber officinale]